MSVKSMRTALKGTSIEEKDAKEIISGVQAMYESWGYRKVGVRQPFPDSPVYAVMLAELPLAR